MEISSSRLARPVVAVATTLLALSAVAAQGGADAAQQGAPQYRLVAASSIKEAESSYASRVLHLVNQRRVDHGLHRVRLSGCVETIALHWATHLADRNLFEHNNLMKLVNTCEVPYASENIAQVSKGVTPRQLVSLWMHSPEHRANILSKKPSSTGIGIRWDADRSVWVAVQNFTKKPGSYQG